MGFFGEVITACLLYTSDAADDRISVDLGGRRIIKKIFFKQKTAYEIRLSLVGSEMCIRDSDAYSASYAKRVLFLKDGRVFNELLRGERGRPVFYHEILDVLAALGGDVSDVI